MYEVGELARFVAGKEQARASHEKDLRCADPRRVELIVHDDRARAVERDTSALIAKALCGAAIRLPQRLAKRDLDPRGEVVVVLLASEVGDLLRDVSAGVSLQTCDLAQEVEASLRPQRRAERGFGRDDHVGRTRSELGGRADLRRQALLSHRWRV